jgi:hypothetical protein
MKNLARKAGPARTTGRGVNEAYEKHRARCNAIGKAVLLAGLGAAVLLYLLAGGGPRDAASLRIDAGNVQQDLTEVSKSYERGLEYYGGKSNVMAYELRLWLEGLFEGRTLAYTVGLASLAVALIFFLLARLVPPGSAADDDAPGPPDNPA